MSKRDDRVTLQQVLAHVEEAIDLAQIEGVDKFAKDRVTQLALTRLVEIIGEAANRLSKDFQLSNSSIPWSEIISMRNKLIHAYDAIDLEILWNTITQDLPLLLIELKKLPT